MDQSDFLAIEQLFLEHSNPKRQAKMEAYVHGKFKYLGVTAPERKALLSSVFRGLKWHREELILFANYCWESEYRELKYAGLDMLSKHHKKLELGDIPVLEKFVLGDSWWDTVDGLAVHAIGKTLVKDFEIRKEWVQKWAASDNIWLKRTAILHQLKLKDRIDIPLLEETIDKANGTKEFFLNKAIGWILREYSRTAPEYVIEYCQTHELSNLSRKEALRLLM